MTILDQFGRPIESRDLRKPETGRLAIAQVRDRWSTYPSNGLTPVRLAQILRAADNGDVLRQAELFEEMEEKDGHIFSQLQTRKLAVQGLEWDVAPGDESAKAKEIATDCEALLEWLTDFDDNILDMLDAIGKGYSMLEILWDASEGRAEITGFEWIHPKKITFWDSLTPRVLTEEEPVRGIDIQPFKWLYHRYKARSGYDTRAGIMRVCAWMYLFKNYAVKDWVGFAEVFGKPMRLGKYDSGASKEDKEALALAVRMLGSDAAGIISKSTEIEFVEAKISGSLNIYLSLTDFCDAQISKAVLGQTLTSDSGSNGSGSYALGNVHNEVRGDLTRADAKALGRTVTQQVIRPYVGFNYGWDAPMPKAIPVYEEPEDLEAVGRVYQVVSGLIDISQEHVSERFKIPLRKKTETPVKQKATGPIIDPSAAKHILKQAQARFTPDQQALEDLADRTVAEAATMMADNEQKIRQALEAAQSYEDAVERLLSIYPDMQVDDFSDLIARMLLNTELYGRSTVAHGEN
ncbi:MAG: hypothetical protein APR55_07085 [Methanolinea sp. SDB]|nr:MAG: hypothetical protein APR55_07085 [Methanolinea sp. SDB]